MKLKAVLFFAVVLPHVEAVAEDHSVGASAGMLGLGLEYAYSFSERLAIRGGIFGSGYSFDQSEAGIDYKTDINWDAVSVALDFYPSRGSLRLSAGVLKNDNSLSLRSSISEDVMVGGVTYTPTEVGTLRGAVGTDSVAPFIGVGWDWSRSKRFGIAFDLGVVSQDSPTVSLSADGSLLDDPMFLTDLAAEEAELENSLADLDLIPFANFGLVFRF